MKKLIAMTLAVASLSTTAAKAHIKCNGNFQVVNGTEISTPYCEDENLARVARKKGIEVTGKQLRSDLGKKAEVCRFLSGLNSVSTACFALNAE